MDDFALQQALEAMAGAAVPDHITATETIDETAQRWQRLFGFDKEEAIDGITQHRNDLSRMILNDEHWATVREEQEAAGFDREAYEYELNLEKRKANLGNVLPVQDTINTVEYLVELKGPLATVDALREAAGLDADPVVVIGKSSETWELVQLCCIDARAKANLLRWASTAGRGHEPTILVNPKSLS